jgi:hypothetical protein
MTARRTSRRREASTPRAIVIGFDVAANAPDAWRLTAECDDELTEILLIGKQWAHLGSMDDAAMLTSGLAEMLVNEHRSRCASCRKWEAA